MHRKSCIDFLTSNLDTSFCSGLIAAIRDHFFIREYSFVSMLDAENPTSNDGIAPHTFRIELKKQTLGTCVMIRSKESLNAIEKSLQQASEKRDVLVICHCDEQFVIQVWSNNHKTDVFCGKVATDHDIQDCIRTLERFAHSKLRISPRELAIELSTRTKNLNTRVKRSLECSYGRFQKIEEWEKGVSQIDWNHDIWNDVPLLKSYIFVHTQLKTLEPLSTHTKPEKGFSTFSDMYAQTVTYGLFAARWISKDSDCSYTMENIERLLPSTSIIVKELFFQLIYVPRVEIQSCIQDIYSYLSIVDVHTVFFNTHDPILHFYEDFLDALEKERKKKRGVYYTPDAVVDFIVRSIDEQLKNKFGLPLGLASTRTWRDVVKFLDHPFEMPEAVADSDIFVRILDPATGTGTFITRVVEQVYANLIEHWDSLKWSHKQKQQEWEAYVYGAQGIEKDYSGNGFLSRLYAFEVMPTPYVIAHLRLGILFQKYSDTPLRLSKNKRIHVFLANALEHPRERKNIDLSCVEEKYADSIKISTSITVVLGNPPYRGVTSNNTAWITEQIECYKYIHGRYFYERKHWLNDDYVRFIRLGELYIARSKIGLLGYINPHGFLDNPTFRGMRKHLLESFDELYILDLHGNARKAEERKERDENVFDIMQGVSINIWTANQSRSCSKSLGTVYAYDVLGSRSSKFQFLHQHRIESIDWKPISMSVYTREFDYYFMVPKDFVGLRRYRDGFSLCTLFLQYTSGIVTARDAVVIDTDKNALCMRMDRFYDVSYTDDQIRNELFLHKKDGKYRAGDTRGWKLSVQRRKKPTQQYEELIKKISYRPFDSRFIFYTPEMIDWGRESIMSHFIHGSNLGLIFKRGGVQPSTPPMFMTKNLIDFRSWSRPGMQGGDSVAPLYQYQNGSASTNISKEVYDRIQKVCTPDEVCTPEDVLDYVYAVAHTPSYFETFADFLSIGYPRIPYPTDRLFFWSRVHKGKELRLLHLFEQKLVCEVHLFNKSGSMAARSKEITQCRPKGETIKKSKIVEGWNGKIWINASQYFTYVPEHIWEMYIGGYQPAKKWLKDRKRTRSRKGMQLTAADIVQYSTIIKVLVETHRIIHELEELERISYDDSPQG